MVLGPGIPPPPPQQYLRGKYYQTTNSSVTIKFNRYIFAGFTLCTFISENILRYQEGRRNVIFVEYQQIDSLESLTLMQRQRGGGPTRLLEYNLCIFGYFVKMIFISVYVRTLFRVENGSFFLDK